MPHAPENRTLIMIPARMASTRLPGKPLADIGGKPMIVQVADRAAEAGFARDAIIVATDTEAIAHAVDKAGYRAVMTRENHPSGSDRIYEALEKVDPDGTFDRIVNLQGDLPTLDPQLISRVAGLLDDAHCDIATLGCEITHEEEKTNPNVVKIVGAPLRDAGVTVHDDVLRALYFTRATAPYGDGPLYHHIGIYAYRRDRLKWLVNTPPSVLEQREKLEQLRALEEGMQIHAAIVDTVPLGVDTAADLERARALLSQG
ncbi:MAG: 3-deoxy-manno-octulosonate cytidylyltransferase [Ahrensia sp.]